MHTNALLNCCIATLEDTKAVDIKVLNVKQLTDITDTLVICSGTSSRHTKSLADNLIKAVKEKGFKVLSLEDDETSDWVLVDLVDVVVHIMLPQTRQFYDLESLWEYDEALLEKQRKQ
jgi:ribosome-associated protein